MFSKISRLDEPEASVQSEQAEPEQFKKRKYIYQEFVPLHLKVLVYLGNPYEEAISESNQIKE